MPQAIRESGPITITAPTEAKAGMLPVALISPGWGSSGYYSAQVLENAAKARVFPKGTQMYIDHETESEKYDRPERSVRDLAATLTEDAVWDGGQLVAEAQVFGPYVDMLTDRDFVEAIGLSIRAYADGIIGEAEGRKGRIITELVEAISVDFVTRAGRGGRVLTELMESARPAQVVGRAIAHGVSEATANDTRTALQAALVELFGGEKSWVWVRDFDESKVWFTHETPDASATYEETYDLDEQQVVTLSGSPIEVRARTEYVPVKAAESGAPQNVPAPAGQPKSKEDKMAMTQAEEAEHSRLTEVAGRVQTAESERDTARTERDAAITDADTLREVANAQARVRVVREAADAAGVTLDQWQIAGLSADAPIGADRLVDEAALRTRVDEAIAKLTEAGGAGKVTGFGSSTTNNTNDVSEAAVDEAVASAFGRQISKEA